ncbi:uncharacterized protein LOC123948375 [Meles meles]|uniref:uncharacterized protein LOC123948375 n=1 Tax=Meles meles TaxID=9662 RepID=UPI001E69CC19|nr:uncharacterized protein LOC123948375 [Meles meles]
MRVTGASTLSRLHPISPPMQHPHKGGRGSDTLRQAHGPPGQKETYCRLVGAGGGGGGGKPEEREAASLWPCSLRRASEGEEVGLAKAGRRGEQRRAGLPVDTDRQDSPLSPLGAPSPRWSELQRPGCSRLCATQPSPSQHPPNIPSARTCSPCGPRADDRRRRGPSLRECLADVSLLGKRRPEIVPAAWGRAAPPRPRAVGDPRRKARSPGLRASQAGGGGGASPR